MPENNWCGIAARPRTRARHSAAEKSPESTCPPAERKCTVGTAAAEVAATPTPGKGAPASPAPSGLSASQLTNLLEQIQKHGADVDVGAVTSEVFRQIAAGASEVSVSPLLRKHAKKKEGVTIEEGVADGEDKGHLSSGLTQDIGAMALPTE